MLSVKFDARFWAFLSTQHLVFDVNFVFQVMNCTNVKPSYGVYVREQHVTAKDANKVASGCERVQRDFFNIFFYQEVLDEASRNDQQYKAIKCGDSVMLCTIPRN